MTTNLPLGGPFLKEQRFSRFARLLADRASIVFVFPRLECHCCHDESHVGGDMRGIWLGT